MEIALREKLGKENIKDFDEEISISKKQSLEDKKEELEKFKEELLKIKENAIPETKKLIKK